MKQYYDVKNEEDFHHNTDLLIRKLEEIERDKSLKPTIKELAKLTGLHRNTISGRQWPVERLNQIKESRKQSKNKKIEKETNELNVVIDKLDDAQKELVYWFSKCQELEESLDQMKKNYTHMSKSREMYEKLLEEERIKVNALEKQIKQLNELLSA